MTSKRKILFIPRWYPGRVDPLKGIFIRRHALSVSLKNEVSVLFISADPGMKNKIYETEILEDEGLKTVRVYYSNSTGSFPVWSLFLKFYRYLKAAHIGIRKMQELIRQPDIVHIHVLSRTFLPAFYFFHYFKTPFIITEQWSGYLPEDGSYKGFLKKYLTRMAVKRASAVTTVSESLRDAMLSHGLKNKYHIIPNVVDVNAFFPAKEKSQREKKFILSVSDMDDRAKNISGVIRVMARLSRERSDFEFHLIGDGADREFLTALARKEGVLGSTVFFEGARPSSVVAETMRQADFFILFSHYDNMPCVMTESLASGLPVIGSAIHGMKEHIRKGLGILVTPGNENELYEAVQKALNGKAHLDPGDMRRYAVEHFSYEAVGERFNSIYDSVTR